MSPSLKTLVKVHLLDNTCCSLNVKKNETCEALCRKVCGHYGFDRATEKLFSLYRSIDGYTIDEELGMDEEFIYEYNHCCKVYFRIRLFTNVCFEHVEPNLLKFLYKQSVYDISLGKYACSVDVLTKLAALQLAEEGFECLSPGSLVTKLLECMPSSAFKAKKPIKWEAEVLREIKLLKGKNICYYAKYVHTMQEWLCAYGYSTYRVLYTNHPDFKAPIVLGVCRFGLAVFDERQTRVVKSFPWKKIQSWGRSSMSNFFFREYRENNIPSRNLVEFTVTDKSEEICRLLTDYANAIEAEKNPRSYKERSKSTNPDPASDIEQKENDTTYLNHNIPPVGKGKSKGMIRRESIIQIQTTYRGYKARCDYDHMISKMDIKANESQVLKEKAATLIAAHVRGYFVRSEIEAIDRDISARIIQNCFRQYMNVSVEQKYQQHILEAKLKAPPLPSCPPPPDYEELDFKPVPPDTPPPNDEYRRKREQYWFEIDEVYRDERV